MFSVSRDLTDDELVALIRARCCVSGEVVDALMPALPGSRIALLKMNTPEQANQVVQTCGLRVPLFSNGRNHRASLCIYK